MRMQKKSWRIAATFAAAALVVTACGDDNGDAEGEGDGETSAPAEEPEFEEGSTMARIQESGTLRVGTKYDQPLFGVNTPSGVEGFDAEIAKLIAEGIWGEGGADNIEWSEAVSAVREQVLQEDQVDIVVATYTINDDRKELVGFAGPYYHAGQDIMVAEGNPEGIESVEDLAGKTVCSAEGSTSIENLREMVPDAEEIIALDTYSACAEELAQGRVDAVSTDNVILLGLIEERGEFELVDNPFTEEPYGIGVQLEADDFRDWINDRLEEIYDSGEWAEAWESTAGAIASTPEPPTVDRY